jgi:L-aminopeptidase/D-esterase-like protein
LGVPFEGETGSLNAITDVAGVEVGHCTLVSGEGPLRVGFGPVRTGVTAVLPQGRTRNEAVPAAWFSLNGNGEMTGTAWLEESGLLGGPVMITNTHSVGTVRDAVIAWLIRRDLKRGPFVLPVVAETYDGWLSDIDGFHVRAEHAFEALDGARGGSFQEGAVGGGTGMIAYHFKGGIGTSSRRLAEAYGGYTLGVLVQANYGRREELIIAGVPVGREIGSHMPERGTTASGDGSIIIIVATDAPLLPHQLGRLAKRASLGLARSGSVAHNGSGDLFLAFSTAAPARREGVEVWRALPNGEMDALFTATVQATEEAIVNALVAAETMTGVEGRTVHALPHDLLRQALLKYKRLSGPS